MATHDELTQLLTGWPGGKPRKLRGQGDLTKVLEHAKGIKTGDCCDDVAAMYTQLVALTEWCIQYKEYVEKAMGGGGGTPPPGPPGFP